MATTNPVTGDEIKSKVNSDSYRDNFDKIFRKDKKDLNEHELEHWVDDHQDSHNS